MAINLEKSFRRPDLIVINGSIHTVDNRDTIVEAIAISGNKLVALGTNDEIEAIATSETVIVDAGGNSVLPGINDSHTHLYGSGNLLDGILTIGVESIEKIKEIIKIKLRDYPKGKWLHGGSWIETQFDERRMLNRYDLDEAAPEHPVVLERIFSTSVANSMALKLAGIDRNTPNPEGGEIGRDAETGEPDGLLYRTAKQLVRNVMDTPASNDGYTFDPRMVEAIERGVDFYLSYGVTSIIEAGVSPALMKAYYSMKKNKTLKIRTNIMPNWHGFSINEDKDYSDRLIKEFGTYTGFGNEWLRIGALKMAIDGGLTSKTQLSSWPYLGENAPREVPLRLDLSKLDSWVKSAHDAGWSVGIHVMGDIAIEKAVDAMYKAYQENPVRRRHQLIHAYYPTSDSLRKMAEMGVIAAIQPAFIYNEADGYDKLLPQEKMDSFLPMRTYLDSGVIVALSTDMACAHVNPFWNLYAAMTRKGIKGFQLGNKETMTLHEAIRAMTLQGAYMTEEEEIKGSLEPGKLADFIVLDGKLLDMDPEKIKHVKVLKTFVDGQCVYNRREA